MDLLPIEFMLCNLAFFDLKVGAKFWMSPKPIKDMLCILALVVLKEGAKFWTSFKPLRPIVFMRHQHLQL